MQIRTSSYERVSALSESNRRRDAPSVATDWHNRKAAVDSGASETATAIPGQRPYHSAHRYDAEKPVLSRLSVSHPVQKALNTYITLQQTLTQDASFAHDALVGVDFYA